MLNAGSEEIFRGLVDGVVGVMGPEWVDEIQSLSDIAAVQLLCGTSIAGAELLRGVRAHATTLDDPQTQQDRGDQALRLRFAGVVHAICEIGHFDGGPHLQKELRDRLCARRFEEFFQRLFEAEAALYWRQLSHDTAISFPDGHHPDFWMEVPTPTSNLRIPHECKRLDPVGQHDRLLDNVAQQIELAIRARGIKGDPLKVTVWLHAAGNAVRVDDLLADLRDVILRAEDRDVDEWITVSACDGTYQISVSTARQCAVFARPPISLPDLPSLPVLRLGAEGRETEDGRILRLSYAISVRSDALPNRVGRFEASLRKALTQIPKSGAGLPGMINIRIRPPRDLGDLYEADAIARRLLETDVGEQVALVTLFWNDSEREAGPPPPGFTPPAEEITLKWHLQAHHVASRRAALNLSHFDSAPTRFPALNGVLMRDPASGGIIPVSRDLLALLEVPERVPVPHDAPTEDQTACTVYFKTTDPYTGRGHQVVRTIAIGGRSFLLLLDNTTCLRTVEFIAGAPARVATLDLRAWIGQDEFCFNLIDTDADWSIVAQHANKMTSARARSMPVRPVYL